MPTDTCLLIGAGGHGCVVLDALLLASPEIDVCVRDDFPTSLPLLGRTVVSPALPPGVFEGAVHVAIGSNEVRCRLASLMCERGGRLLSVVHPVATVSPHATLGEGVFVAARAVIAPRARVGDGVIVNHGAVVDHDCEVGAWSHIAPGSVLGGGVTTGRRVLVGSGAIILPGLHIGDDAIIAAGAVVTKDVAEGQLKVGIPARNRHG
ncbi:acetyltransferase [Methyloversatilis sp.]|uniref:acetyltransferase n=1 Tax=Methyloversatilis sp. TaxID=2569862 RepID=UPI0027340EB7|nr:acetyltransferase [Methyloversatilis sp.]MDP2870397.1 acetyltransferase [Methyloversatilis sp.]MDP3457114.1 acetyltransferase [Methyloversatilis sp.]MDP3576799.1 acetyltransferase [Methyloversatilis sp.]